MLQFVNLFHELLNLEPISTNELELNESGDEIDKRYVFIVSQTLIDILRCNIVRK